MHPLEHCEAGIATEAVLQPAQLQLEVDKQALRWTRSGSSDLRTPGRVSGSDEELAHGQSTLTFRDVSFSVKATGSKGGETQILAPVSGHFEPGTLAAVMGPSGSGKTTLVDILANKKRAPHGGTVYFNGRPRDKLFHRMTAYVPQNDVMPPFLTVKEALIFHGALKEQWPSGFTSKMASKLMDKRLKLLGLYEVRDSRIGDEHVRGISGGQRRRLSLARGIASGARLLFCDEPTSGLSATDAELCVQYMKVIAGRYGTTIVVVIHQPRVEVAELFDHLLLLTSSPGRVVYNGPMSDSVVHFEKVLGKSMPARVNPMDWCMDLVTPGSRGSCQDECVIYYNSSCRENIERFVTTELENERSTPIELLEKKRGNMLQYGKMPPVRNSKFGVRFFRQCQLVFCRQLTLSLRDRQGLVADLAVASAKAVVVGIAYLNIGQLQPGQHCGFFFMVLMSCSIEGMKNMPKIIGDRTIMKMETSEALYSEWAYIISFTVINWAQTLLSNVVYVVILFAMSGLRWEMFGSVLFWTMLVSLTMDSLYLMVASIAKDSASAFLLATPVLMMFLLYNGFTATKTTVPWFMTWAVQLSPVARAMEALVVAASKVYGGDAYGSLTTHFGYVDDPQAALQVIVACFAVFRVVQMICLQKMNNIQR